MSMQQESKDKLHNLKMLAAILTLADDWHTRKGEPVYNQNILQHECDTPACAYGHWLAYKGVPIPKSITEYGEHSWDSISSEFNISRSEAILIFAIGGCNNAQTSKDAAAFITNFIQKRPARDFSDEYETEWDFLDE